MMVGLVAALHYYLGVRLVSDPGLARPWAGLGWSVLWLGFASIPAAMASTRMKPSWKEQVLHWGGMLFAFRTARAPARVERVTVPVTGLGAHQPRVAVLAQGILVSA